ncbi:carboxypeptidase-like regulatory domain-containing protein [Halostella sp. PRR32]|uniref:carboxypeptidase-like regulatory domain-containing protein n=1 Tax=Halostella sp. PRR32 TaxID=3098147 RepID=UPI002B1D46FE|nr:carboxypeptidase-like regulatory domain-containing protein [Halostella sp. PRR32]
MTTTNSKDKVRSLVLAALMVFSVVGGSIAFAGAAAAANAPGDNGGVTDNTESVNALSGEETEVADLDFSGDSGEMNNITVNVAGGANSANVNVDDVTDVRVVAYNDSDVLAEASASYATHGTVVDFNGTDADSETNGTVDRVEVYAQLASSATVDGNEDLDASVELQADDGTSSGAIDTLGVQSITTDSSFISGEVEDSNGEPIENAQVEIVNNDNGATVATLTTDANGQFDPSRVRVAPGQNYTVNVDRFGYTTYSQTQFVGSQETVNFPVTLEFNLQPDNVDVQRFDNGEVAGTSSTLLGNNESDNTATYAVVVENTNVENAGTPIDSSEFSIDVDLEFNKTDANVGDFWDNDAINTSTTVTTTERGDIDGDGYSESYVTFNVTADNASADTLANPLTEVGINASNAENNLQDNDATVQYVLEGEEKITGEVVDIDGEGVSDATVWAVYEGSGNQSVAFTENTFVNDDGNAFLVDETNDDGRYAIPGLAGNDTNVTVYVTATNYNRENLTDTSVGQFVAASEFEQTAGPKSETENHDIVVAPVDVTLDYRLNLSAEGEDGNYSDSIAMGISSERDVRVGLDVKAQNEPDSAFTPIENSDLVDSEDVNFSTNNTVIGNVVDDPLTVTESNETTVFQSTRSTGVANLTAEVTNGEDMVFNDTVQIEVYGVGEITGDVVNDKNPADNLPGAKVDLLRVENNGSETLLDTDYTGPQGSYSFTEVRTGETYRLVGTFENETGFNEIYKGSAGTTNADIVIVGVTPDAATFDVSDLSPSNKTVTQGDQIDVSATVTNIGDEQGTQTVELRVDGNTLASQDVQLVGDENVTVTFDDVDTSGLAAGDHTHGVYTEDDDQTGTLTVESSDDDNSNSSIVAEYDANNNGEIDLMELSAAANAYSSGQISLMELSQVAGAYSS